MLSAEVEPSILDHNCNEAAASRLEVCADQFTDLVVESVLPLPHDMHIARWITPTKIT